MSQTDRQNHDVEAIDLFEETNPADGPEDGGQAADGAPIGAHSAGVPAARGPAGGSPAGGSGDGDPVGGPAGESPEAGDPAEDSPGTGSLAGGSPAGGSAGGPDAATPAPATPAPATPAPATPAPDALAPDAPPARRAIRSALLAVGSLLLALAAVYAAGILYFSSHFGLNTTIDGRNVTFMTVDEAEGRIALNAAKFEMTVVGREGLESTIQAADVGLRYAPDGQLQEALSSQDPLLWPLRLLPQAATTTTPSFRYDALLLRGYLDASEILSPDSMRPPADAYAAFENGAWLVASEDPGTTLDGLATYQAIADALTAGQPLCDLDEAQCYVQPQVIADDDELIRQVERFNIYVPFKIVYTFGDKSEVLDGYTAIQWFSENADGLMTLNEGALDAWLDGFCARHDTVGIERTFMSTRGDAIDVSGGSYGWQVDRWAERDAILAAMAGRRSEEREPHYLQRAQVHPEQAGDVDWGDTYIEIDQTTQKLYYYQDGELMLETDIVTGLPTPMWTTPCGAWYVLTRVSPARLRGPIQQDGNPMWDSVVQFWMGVTLSGVGIHDAYWQPWFGGNRYQYGGSHGCINLPYAKARDLYYMVEVGTPVIIFW